MKRLIACLIPLLLWQGSAMARDKPSILLGINAGISVQQGFDNLQYKYQGLADYLSQALNEPVRFEASQNLKGSVHNLGKARYDLMFVKPSNMAALAIRDDKYTLVASCAGTLAAGTLNSIFIVSKDSPLKKPADIRGKRIAMPAPKSLIALAALATLRDLGIDPATQNIQFSRLQEAVVYMLKQHFVDVAAVNPVLAKAWVKNGGRILLKSKNLPMWSIIASPDMKPSLVTKVRQALLTMQDTDAGKKVLTQIGVNGFIRGNANDYLNMLKWIRK